MIVSLASLTLAGRAQTALPDPSTTGPKVGERIQDFNLTDLNGRNVPLGSIMKTKGAMLVFFRSTEW